MTEIGEFISVEHRVIRASDHKSLTEHNEKSFPDLLYTGIQSHIPPLLAGIYPTVLRARKEAHHHGRSTWGKADPRDWCLLTVPGPPTRRSEDGSSLSS